MGDLTIRDKIYETRGQRVMLDFDLAGMYGVETRRLNEQVKRNQIATSNHADYQHHENWTSQIATSNFLKMGLRKRPYAFTEMGVAMLSSVLRSPLAELQTQTPNAKPRRRIGFISD